MPDPEAVAAWVYERTFCSRFQPPGPAELLERLIGADRIAFGHEGALVQRGASGFHVAIPSGLPREMLCVRLGLAVARVAQSMRWNEVWSDEETGRLTLAIVIPRDAIANLMLQKTPSADDVARMFVVPPEIAARRLRALGLSVTSGQYRRSSLLDVG